MTDKQDTEKSKDRENEPRQRFRHSRRLGMVRSLMINIALIVMPLLVYFVVVIEHSSAYTDERSLRALQEIATQVDNRLDTLENMISFAPGELQKRIDSERGSLSLEFYFKTNAQQVTQMVKAIPGVPVQKFSFVEAKVACPPLENAAPSKDAAPLKDAEIQESAESHARLIVNKARNPILRMVDCDAKPWNHVIQYKIIQEDSSLPVVEKGAPQPVVEEGSSRPVVETTFSEMIENTQALTEIPLIIVASQRGEVYAQLMRNHGKDPNPPAHEEIREEPTVGNLREILIGAEKHAVDELLRKNELLGKDEASNPVKPKGGDDPPEAKQLGLPVALDTHIAGTPYRAYVLPYPLKVPVCEVDIATKDKSATAQCTGEQTTIYLVGLRKSGLVARAAGSLSPLLLLGALLALIAACLLWPFLRHALLEPNDAVTWRQVRILCVAFLVLTTLGVLAARASELGHFMYEKMDHALEVVAGDIDRQLNKRIVTELEVMDLLKDNPLNKPSLNARNGAAPEATAMPEGEVPEKNYPIVEQFFQTDARGMAVKGSPTYDAITEKWTTLYEDVDLSKRPYFYLLKEGHGVREYLPEDGHGVRTPYWRNAPILLQRLFNKSDGKKILQLAVANRDEVNDFEGISGANIGTIEVISPVLPVGIGYTIFERSTGTVVFHSDDSRSLVENFYAETEHNPALSSAVDSETTEGTLFNGRYRGANTTFFYRPMMYSPWGLVVFYDSSGVSAVVALSVVSALAATVITLLGGLALAHAVIRLAHRRHSWLWPQWRLRNAYPTACVYLAVVSICEFQILRHAQGSVWQVTVLLTAPLLVLTACFSALSARTPEITARRPGFLRRGLSLVQWSLLLHSVLLLTWAIAAGATGKYWAYFALLLAFLAWVTLLGRSAELPNVNPWRRDLSLWPGSVMPAMGRASYRMRYLLFVVSLAFVVSAVPTLAIFDRTFEWYLSSALDLARTRTSEQWNARVQRMEEGAHELPESSRKVAARKLGGFGVKFDEAGPFYIDGMGLFGVESPTSCFHPPVAWPLGVWERKMHWNQGLLERLRQGALASEASGPEHTDGTDARMKCGPRGTIHELLHAGGISFMSVLWDIVAGLVVLALLMLLLNFSARHVMGISLPWSGRFGRQSAPPVAGPEAAGGEGAPIAPRHILLLQSDEESLRRVRDRKGIREVDVAADSLDKLKPIDSNQKTWLLRRVEIAVLDESRRVTLLGLLEALVADPNARVVAIGDVSPVYRIARPQAYPGPSWPRIDDYERLRWIDLFTHFHKVYSVDDMEAMFEPAEGGARVESAPNDPRGRELDELIHRETRALWPCLRPIRGILLDRLHANTDMTDRDVIELVALHGEIHYRKAWEYCTREERLALYHLAQGKLINMANHRVIEHLLRRGLVVFEPEPRVKSVSLTEFILNAELPGRMEAWAAEAAEGLWQSVRVPFFVVLMLVVAWIAYSSGDAFQAVVALVATSVAVIGQAVRLLGLAGFSASTKEK